MKLNNKGFAVSIILYSIISVIILILLMVLAVYATNTHNKLTQADRLKERISNLDNLNNKILANNSIITSTPTLAQTSSSDVSGLYKSISTLNNNPTYYFRGVVENNYVQMGKDTNGNPLIWRIIRINEDGTIRIILETGINNNQSYAFNNNPTESSSIYYTESTVKSVLENWFKNNITNKSLSKYVETGNYYCEQAKASITEEYGTATNATMTLYTNYVPDFKCIKDENRKGLIKSGVGLISYDEVVYAGGNYGEDNPTYYLNNGSRFYTNSPAGFGTKAYEWVVLNDGSIATNTVDTTYTIRPVVNLKSYLPVTGIGSESDPYVLK